MKILKIQRLLIAAALTSVLFACHKKEDVVTVTPTAAQRAGVYVLNQGSYGGNNGTLTYYDYTSKKLTADIFSTVNGKGLGDTPNDIKIYGSKMYIAVDVSGVIQIADAKTAKILKTFDQKTGTTSREPRSFAFYNNKAFVSQYDGTVAVIDTATLTIDKYITVGRNPEQMAVSNGKLYVANSGGLSFGNPDKTVSVIDLTSLTVTKTITVIADPGTVAADSYGNVYVFSSGDYKTIKAGLTIIDSSTDIVKSQTNAITASYGSPMVINGDVAYFLTTDSKGANIVGIYNVKTQTLGTASFITDGTAIVTPYSVAYDSLTGELFVTDAKNYTSNGELFAFDQNGKKEYSITTGINPGAVAFVNK